MTVGDEDVAAWSTNMLLSVGRPGTTRTSVERFLRAQVFQVVGADLRGQHVEGCRQVQKDQCSQVTGVDRKQDV